MFLYIFKKLTNYRQRDTIAIVRTLFVAALLFVLASSPASAEVVTSVQTSHPQAINAQQNGSNSTMNVQVQNIQPVKQEETIFAPNNTQQSQPTAAPIQQSQPAYNPPQETVEQVLPTIQPTVEPTQSETLTPKKVETGENENGLWEVLTFATHSVVNFFKRLF